MKTSQVIIKPLLTEKSTDLVKQQQYSFLVNNAANKYQIKQTLEGIYKVKVGKIQIIVRKGKVKRVGKKGIPQQKANRKIAIVNLKEGKIDLFPQA